MAFGAHIHPPYRKKTIDYGDRVSLFFNFNFSTSKKEWSG